MAKKMFKPNSGAGSLVIIGGHEDKSGEMEILKVVAEKARGEAIVVVTVASHVGDELWSDYQTAFSKIGVETLHHLSSVSRNAAADAHLVETISKSSVVFFTGGDQLKITSELGGTSVLAAIRALYERGGTIAGTSAGASVMSETMLVSGKADASFRMGSSLRMAPGLGLTHDIIVDQHFAERGRIGRLLGAIAQNPKNIGVGIDENTAIVMDDEKEFRVIGAGSVYVVDARQASHSNISEASEESSLSIFNVGLHLLSAGDSYGLASGQATRGGRTNDEAR